MKEKIIVFILLCFMSIGSAIAQNITVTGTVIDENNEPVIGAAILVEGTDLGTISDLDGRFELREVPGDSHLNVSCLGMVEHRVKAAPTVHVVLVYDTHQIDEVVVTAMGIQRQARAIGYATDKVDSDELTMAKGSDASQALTGKVSGLQITLPGSSLDQETHVTLRGARSFKGDNTALLVLDGVQTPMNFLQTLNPNDIESISVLKGASAAALYGSEAANGVLIVTTKEGEKGKPSITYSLTTTFNKAAYFPKYQSRFGAGHTTSYGSASFLGNGYTSDENQQYGPEFDGMDIEIGSPLYDGSEDGYYLTVPYAYVDGGRDSFYRTGVGIQHDISYSSSDDHGSMYLSYQYLDQNGIIKGDESVRQTVRLNATRKYKNFKAGTNVTYSHMDYDVTSAASSAISSLNNLPGNINMSDYQNWREEDGTGASPNEWINDYYSNPYFVIDTNRRQTRLDRLVGSIDLEYKATDWLRFTARAGMNLSVNNTEKTTEAFHYSSWASENIYRARADQNSSYDTSSQTNTRYTMDIMGFFEKRLSKDFELKVMLGYSLQANRTEYKYVSAGTLALDELYNLSNMIGELTGSNEWTRSRKIGLYGSIDLSFKNWAFLQVTGRNDWTSLLDPSHCSFFYPSANASVVLTDAIPAMKSNVMNHMKVRFSAARVGTVNLEPYSLQSTATVNEYFPYGTLTGYTLSTTIYSQNLEPEFTTEYEVGAEFGFLNNRINFEAAAYRQKTTNQTVSVSMATSTGYESRYINAGTMVGKGLEMDLGLTPLLQLGDFFWNVSGNVTFVDTKVTELAGGATELLLDDSGDGLPIYAVVGESFPVIKATDWKRDPEGRVIVDAETGMPSAGETVICGTTQPKVRLGLTTTLRWRDLSLGATFEYRGGHKTRFAIENTMLFAGSSYLSSTAGRQRFVFPNSVIAVTDNDGNTSYVENTDVTVYDGGDDFWYGYYAQGVANQVVSAASWRLRELSLNYDFPSKLINRIGFIKAISVSLVGRNLFMWTPKTNIWGDPDFTSTGATSDITATSYNSNISGYVSAASPSARSYGFSILVSF